MDGVVFDLSDRKLDQLSVSKSSRELLASSRGEFLERALGPDPVETDVLLSEIKPPKEAKMLTFVRERKLLSKWSGTKYCCTLYKSLSVIFSLAAGVKVPLPGFVSSEVAAWCNVKLSSKLAASSSHRCFRVIL